MRDALNDFGTVSTTDSTNHIDFGPVDERASFDGHRTGAQHDSTVVFSASAALTAALGVILQDSDDNTTFANLVTGPSVPVGAGPGIVAVIPFPLKHRRYVRALITGGSGTIKAWFEPGPAH
jgi:hypothetical protein